MDKLVCLIILNWNGLDDTIECIESCFKLTYSNFYILLVDNASSDGSESILRERYPDINFIQTGENLGFAGGNNVGIKFALENDADYVWLLNNDTVVDSEALSELVKVAEKSESNAIVGSKIYFYNEPKKIWFAGGIWRKNKLFASHFGDGEVDVGQYDKICEVDYITGCSLLVKSTVIKEIGMMNEKYFMYWEDVDWGATVHKKGWKNIHVPTSFVWHKISSSMKKQSHKQVYYFIRGSLLFFQKYAPERLPLVFIVIIRDILFSFKKGQRDIANSYIKALLDFVTGHFGKSGS